MSWLQPISTRDLTETQINMYHANMQKHVDTVMGNAVISDVEPANNAPGTKCAAASDHKFDSGISLGKTTMGWRSMHHATTMNGQPQHSDNAYLDGGSGMTFEEAQQLARTATNKQEPEIVKNASAQTQVKLDKR